MDDDHPYTLTDTVTRGAIGETFLTFHTSIVQVPALERYRTTRNRVALSFTPNMRGNFDRVERVIEEQITLGRRLKEMETRRTRWSDIAEFGTTTQAGALRSCEVLA